MPNMKLLLDTNVIIDYLAQREDFYEKARLLMICGRLGEFSLWISSSQITDLIYILTEGGKKSRVPGVLEALRGVRHIVNVCNVAESDIDRLLASTWDDPEDGMLIELALRIKADAIISRDAGFPHSDMVRVFDCDEFFGWLEQERGITYNEVEP